MDKPGRSNVWAPRSDRAPVLWPSTLSRFADESRAQFQHYLIADTAPGRLMPFIPVAFAAGIIVYFAAEQEPQIWAVSAAFSVLVAGVVLARKRPLAFPLLLAFAAIALGFAIATIRSNLIAHPILSRPTSTIAMTGWVEAREQRERTDRIILRVTTMEELRLGEKLERVRISLRKGLAPPVGSFVALKARLSPPMPAARPGGYDFARDLFFQRIGATGLASGDIKRLDGAAPSFRLRIAAAIQGLRDAIDERIRSSVPGDAGSIASALITGKRDAISANVNEAMYVSSLAHVLSISGYQLRMPCRSKHAHARALIS